MLPFSRNAQKTLETNDEIGELYGREASEQGAVQPHSAFSA
jgi:hypothetical protein